MVATRSQDYGYQGNAYPHLDPEDSGDAPRGPQRRPASSSGMQDPEENISGPNMVPHARQSYGSGPDGGLEEFLSTYEDEFVSSREEESRPRPVATPRRPMGPTETRATVFNRASEKIESSAAARPERRKFTAKTAELFDDEDELRELFADTFAMLLARRRGTNSEREWKVEEPKLKEEQTPEREKSNAGTMNVGIFTPGAEGGASFIAERRPKKIPKLPILKELIQLPSHLRICEMVLIEDDIPLERLVTKVAVLETMKEFSHLMAAGNSMINLPWETLKGNLLKEFCDPNVMRSELELLLGRLKFDPAHMVHFVHETRRLWSLKTADVDQRWFVSKLFEPLPADLLEDLIYEARRRNSKEDWRSHDVSVLLDLLSDVVISRNAMYAIKGVPTSKVSDRVQYTKETRPNRFKSDSPERKEGPVREWITKQAGRTLFYVRTQDPRKIESLRGLAQEVKECRRRDGARYHLAVFTDPEQGLRTLEANFAPGEFREFVTKN